MVWQDVLNISTKLLLISMMFSFGLTMTFKDVSQPLKRYRFMVLAVILNLLIIPLIAFGLAILFGIANELAVGFVLIAMAPGAAFAPKLTQISKADIPLSIALMFLLALSGIITIPLTLLFMIPGPVSANPLPIALNLILFQLLPLFIGIILFTYWAKGAQTLSRIFSLLTNIFMIMVIVLTIALYWSLLVNVFGQLLIFSVLITIGFSILLGFVLGGPGRESREVLTYGTTQRNAGAAMMIAMTSFALIPAVLVSVVVYSLIQIIFVVVIAFIFKRQKESSKDSPMKK